MEHRRECVSVLQLASLYLVVVLPSFLPEVRGECTVSLECPECVLFAGKCALRSSGVNKRTARYSKQIDRLEDLPDALTRT